MKVLELEDQVTCLTTDLARLGQEYVAALATARHEGNTPDSRSHCDSAYARLAAAMIALDGARRRLRRSCHGCVALAEYQLPSPGCARHRPLLRCR